MTEPSFTLTTVPDDDNTDVPPPTDAPLNNFEYACEVCGKELHYAGRGRKPRFCDEHKRGSSSSKSPRKTAASESQARTAAALLARLNTMAGFSLMAFGLPMTAEAMNNANDQFEAMAYEALLTDPALCRKILSAGANSGKAGLTMAYVMFAGAIGPVAFLEVSRKRKSLDSEEDHG